jgi:prepilin-type N-terminal cleavage/methylation domain-containing protein
MEKSLSRRNAQSQRGFTLIETMVAIVVLAIGLMSMAALISQSVRGSTNSRSMSSASMLTTEKLEDLNRYSITDPGVALGGGIGADVAGYFDTIQVSTGSGMISENYNGNVVTHSANGTVTNVAPAASPEIQTFDRRWVIEAGPVANTRRITVLVTLQNQAAGSPVTFQSSLVRP